MYLGGGGGYEFVARCQKMVSIDHETFSGVDVPAIEPSPNNVCC